MPVDFAAKLSLRRNQPTFILTLSSRSTIRHTCLMRPHYLQKSISWCTSHGEMNLGSGVIVVDRANMAGLKQPNQPYHPRTSQHFE